MIRALVTAVNCCFCTYAMQRAASGGDVVDARTLNGDERVRSRSKSPVPVKRKVLYGIF